MSSELRITRTESQRETIQEGQEADVMALIASRLGMGRAVYGPLDVADGRDWLEEALEEQIDGLIYLACRLIQARDKSKRLP